MPAYCEDGNGARQECYYGPSKPTWSLAASFHRAFIVIPPDKTNGKARHF